VQPLPADSGFAIHDYGHIAGCAVVFFLAAADATNAGFSAFLAAASSFPVGEDPYSAKNRRRLFLIPGMIPAAGVNVLYATNTQQRRTRRAPTTHHSRTNCGSAKP